MWYSVLNLLLTPISLPCLFAQGLTIIAFNGGFDSKTLRELLSLGPTYVVMKFIQSMCLFEFVKFYSDLITILICKPSWCVAGSFLTCWCSCFLIVISFFAAGVLDILMMYGAYSTSRSLAVTRIFLRFLCFSAASVFICFLYVYGVIFHVIFLLFKTYWWWSYFCILVMHAIFELYNLSYCRKALEEKSKPNAESVLFKIYVIVIAIYAGVQILLSTLMRIPACHRLSNQCDNWPFVRFIKWMHQVQWSH